IFCVQRVTQKLVEAEEFEGVLKAGEALRVEAARLRALRAEYNGMPEPSRWERSRMRKHRQLAESTLEAWAAVKLEFEERIRGGVPPRVRVQVDEALEDFAEARAQAFDDMSAYLE